MGFVQPHRVNGVAVSGFYEKVSSAADTTSFASQLAGNREIIRFNEGTTRVETFLDDNSNTAYRFNLTNPYLVGGFQLMVFWQQDDTSATFVGNGYSLIPDLVTAETAGDFTITEDPHYIEESSTSIVFYNAQNLFPLLTSNAGNANGLMFVVPHTGTPAVSTSRLIVSNQGDNVAIDLQGSGDGMIMRSPNGTKYIVQIDDGGNFTSRLF